MRVVVRAFRAVISYYRIRSGTMAKIVTVVDRKKEVAVSGAVGIEYRCWRPFGSEIGEVLDEYFQVEGRVTGGTEWHEIPCREPSGPLEQVQMQVEAAIDCIIGYAREKGVRLVATGATCPCEIALSDGDIEAISDSEYYERHGAIS